MRRRPEHQKQRVILLVGLLVLASCGRKDPSVPLLREGPWTEPLAVRASLPFPRRFTDADGSERVIERAPQRIASGTLFTDTVLLAICPLERIAALHATSTNPLFSPVAVESAAFGRHVTSDPETFLAARPDLVFLADFSDKRTQYLISSADRVVLRMNRFDSIRGVQHNIRAVGFVLGLDREAEDLVEAMQRRLDAVAVNRAARSGWRLLSWADGFAAGSRTTFDDVLRYVGAGNAAAEVGVIGAAPLGPERVLALSPDALVIGVPEGGEAEARRRLAQMSSLRSLAAVRENRIICVPNSLFLSSSHHLAGTAEFIASTLDSWGSKPGDGKKK